MDRLLQQPIDWRTPRTRLLMTAYHYDRAHSMESRLSWQRAQYAAEEYDVTVICARSERDGGNDRVTAIELPANQVEQTLMSRTSGNILRDRIARSAAVKPENARSHLSGDY